MPENDWVQQGDIALTTDPDLEPGSPVKAGDAITLAPRTVLVLRGT